METAKKRRTESIENEKHFVWLQSEESESQASSLSRRKSQDVVGAKLVPTTREQYAKTASFIESFCGRHIPNAVDADGRLLLPMQLDVLENSMGAMAGYKVDGVLINV